MIARAIALFERATYLDFIRSDVRDFLERAGVDVRVDRTVLFGLGRVVIGRRPAECANS